MVGRPQQFSEPQVLEAAMHAFWRNGYTATSMADLRAATGLNSGSIYNRYGSKKGLFLDTVAFYIDQVVDQRIDAILNMGDPLVGIEAFFTSAFESVPKQDLIGCLLTNTAMDKESSDAQINPLVRQGLIRIERAIKDRLTEAQRNGQLSANADPASLAVHLVSCFQGLGVMGRVARDKKQLRLITQMALSSLVR